MGALALAPGEHRMEDGRRTNELRALVTNRTAVEVIEESLAAAEQDRHDRQVHLVDQPRPKILLDGGRTTAEPDILAGGCRESLVERRLDRRSPWLVSSRLECSECSQTEMTVVLM